MKKKRRNMISALLLLGMLLSGALSPLNANAAPGQEETQPSEEMEEILSAEPLDAGEPERTEPVHGRAAYTKDVFFPDTILQGIFSSSELYFYIPEYWETKYVYVELEYTVSQLIQSIASSMTFSVNGSPVSSCRVAYENGDTQIAYVEIPMELIKYGYNSFTVAAYARLYDEEGCIDDFSNANWLAISEESYIRCGYEVKNHEHRISGYPYPFMSTTEETGRGLSIAVSDKAENSEIAAAMNLMADLSTETVGENCIQFTLFSDLGKVGTDRTVLVSLYENLPAEYQRRITDTRGLDEQAVVLFTDDEQGFPLLLITSENGDCLLEAVYMLMDEDRVSQEKGSIARVHLGSGDMVANSNAVSRMAAGNYTVEELVGSGLSFIGPFHKEQLIYLPFSEDYFLSDTGKITLNFRYSENLDFSRSMISVYWGNVPIASKKLEKEKAAGDELIFSMPPDVVGTTAGAIRIAFDLEIPDMVCTQRQDQMPWAYVSEKSTLYLPASTGMILTFDLKPSPFRIDGKFNDLLLVISDKPTTEELNLYAQIIGMYGNGVNPYGTFYVKRAGEFSEKDSDYNIITVGTCKSNELLQKLNDSLYFSYREDGSGFNSNEQLILSDSYAGQIAIMQLLKSPYAKNRGILAVTGATEDTLGNAEKFMRDEKLRYSLVKDCVLIDQELETRSFQFINHTVDRVNPTLSENLSQNKQSVIFTIVATSMMLMLLIAVIIILIRIRMYHRKRDEE